MTMQEISQEYLTLFSAITEAKKELDLISARLILAQRVAEDVFLREGDEKAPVGSIKHRTRDRHAFPAACRSRAGIRR